jgi:hypothetical protein
MSPYFLLPFELGGRQHPASQMLAFRVLSHPDVIELILPRFGKGFGVPAPYPFPLE